MTKVYTPRLFSRQTDERSFRAFSIIYIFFFLIFFGNTLEFWREFWQLKNHSIIKFPLFSFIILFEDEVRVFLNFVRLKDIIRIFKKINAGNSFLVCRKL